MTAHSLQYGGATIMTSAGFPECLADRALRQLARGKLERAEEIHPTVGRVGRQSERVHDYDGCS